RAAALSFCPAARLYHILYPLSSDEVEATSDGTRQGLDSMRGGVCATQGMKVVLKVGQSPYGLPPKKEPAGRTTSRNPGTPHPTPSRQENRKSKGVIECRQSPLLLLQAQMGAIGLHYTWIGRVKLSKEKERVKV
ncbi:hypothetical protein INR49_027933, partial [Caranx melampygus]